MKKVQIYSTKDYKPLNISDPIKTHEEEIQEQVSVVDIIEIFEVNDLVELQEDITFFGKADPVYLNKGDVLQVVEVDEQTLSSHAFVTYTLFDLATSRYVATTSFETFLKEVKQNA